MTAFVIAFVLIAIGLTASPAAAFIGAIGAAIMLITMVRFAIYCWRN